MDQGQGPMLGGSASGAFGDDGRVSIGVSIGGIGGPVGHDYEMNWFSNPLQSLFQPHSNLIRAGLTWFSCALMLSGDSFRSIGRVYFSRQDAARGKGQVAGRQAWAAPGAEVDLIREK